MQEEMNIWAGKPTILYLIPRIFLIGLLGGAYTYTYGMNFEFDLYFGFGLLVLCFPLVWYYLVLSTWDYRITDQRLFESKGVLNKKRDEIELYRIKDFSITEPFLLRFFGIGNIHLVTSDRSHPKLTLKGIDNPQIVMDRLRKSVEEQRALKGVREFD